MRLRTTHPATTRLRNDAVTDGYGAIEFGPVKTPPDSDAYRISQEVPADVGEALVAHYDALAPHTTTSDSDSDSETT